jgi:hypothetical protein
LYRYTKAYVSALAKLAAAVPLRPCDTIQDAEERAAAQGTLARGAGAATLASGRVAEKVPAGRADTFHLRFIRFFSQSKHI